MRIGVDTNVLVRIRDADDPNHRPCIEALRRLANDGHERCLCAQVLIEYWVVATRPRKVNGLGLSVEDAALDLQDFLHGFTVLDEPRDILERWSGLVAEYQVRGIPAHDARLVALLTAHGVGRLFTLNPSDFARYRDFVCVGHADV